MASGIPVSSLPLPTVLVSVLAAREISGSGRDNVQLLLSVEPEGAGDFRLTVQKSEGARGPGNTVVGDFKLVDISYEVISPGCHELSVLGNPGSKMILHFDDEREAQKWWTVVSSSIRETRKAVQGLGAFFRTKPPVPNKPREADVPSPDAELLMPPTDLYAKEDLAIRLSRSIEGGDQKMAAHYAMELSKQKAPVQIQLKPMCYPRNEICMKVGVEDATASVNISIYLHSQTTIAVLKQQIFRDYQFHPSIQRWIIGQCLCADDRTVGSYGIRQDGDTAFLYLLSAKQVNLLPQEQNASSIIHPPVTAPSWEEHKYKTMPNRPTPRNVSYGCRQENVDPCRTLLLELPLLSINPKPVPPAPPSPAQPGWACPVCTYINKPTRPGCEMCSTDRPSNYMVPDKYKPDETEQRRLQQEKDSLQQYRQEKGRREDGSSSQPEPTAGSLDDFILLST